MPADSFADPVHFNAELRPSPTIIIAKELDPIGQFLRELDEIAHEAEGITRSSAGRYMLLADAEILDNAAELLTKASERLKGHGDPF